MKEHYPLLKQQYELVRSSRQVLLNYCKTIRPADLLYEKSAFGRGGSIRNLSVHIVNTYEFWVAQWALKNDVIFTAYDQVTTTDKLIAAFEAVDAFMDRFIALFQHEHLPERIEYVLNEKQKHTDPFTLFSHVITHEFHHKGQILSLTRHLGFVPVDTDVMR